MAKALTPETAADVVDPKHNVAARHQLIRDGFKTVLRLEREKDGLEDKHIKPLKEEIGKKWKSLKADCNIELTDLKLQYKLWKRQEDSKAFDEAEERDRVQDGLRQIFEALHEGEMYDFIDGIEQIEKEDGDKSAGKAEDGEVFDKLEVAFQEGHDRTIRGENAQEACTYSEGSAEAREYHKGVAKASEKLLMKPNQTRLNQMVKEADARLKANGKELGTVPKAVKEALNKPAPKSSTQELETAETQGAA